MSYEVTVYIDIEGRLLQTSPQHLSLLKMLSKLGVKSANSRSMMTLTTTVPQAGTYNVSYSMNGQQMVATITVQDPIATLVPKLEMPAARWDDKPTRADRRSWRQQSAKHGRNTGRR